MSNPYKLDTDNKDPKFKGKIYRTHPESGMKFYPENHPDYSKKKSVIEAGERLRKEHEMPYWGKGE